MWAPIVNNIVAIAGLGMFIAIMGANASNPHTIDNWGSFQTILVAGFSTIGVVAQTAILLIPVFRLRLGPAPALRLAGGRAGPRREAERLDAGDRRRRAAGVPLRHAHRDDPRR